MWTMAGSQITTTTDVTPTDVSYSRGLETTTSVRHVIGEGSSREFMNSARTVHDSLESQTSSPRRPWYRPQWGWRSTTVADEMEPRRESRGPASLSHDTGPNSNGPVHYTIDTRP
jgi:hypothetical protein